MAQNGTATATRKTSSNGNGAGRSTTRKATQTKSAAKSSAKSGSDKAKQKAEETADDAKGSFAEKAKVAAIATGSAAIGAAGGYAGASLTNGQGQKRSTMSVPKLKPSMSIKLIAGAAKLGYAIGRRREKLTSS